MIKTSHQVLTAPKSDSESSNAAVDNSCAARTTRDGIFEQDVYSRRMKEKSRSIEAQKNGWMSSISSTLAIPGNRRFVLDVTGRVTFETIRSLVEFLFQKLLDGLKRSLSVVREEVLDRGLEVVRYIGAKSSVIVAICLALYLHILGGTTTFLPA
ncbi:hypothetical protein RJ639_038365 [Escallonia herrerae]|uniref:Uncharacterized protein n=1 Tax=Escallonia herrerae TaxID=1293975 RepID=A0AA89BAQ3_9ASTE|nr:hypothetical protein RJ639_038365 [Escallonia herrerae]